MLAMLSLAALKDARLFRPGAPHIELRYQTFTLEVTFVSMEQKLWVIARHEAEEKRCEVAITEAALQFGSRMYLTCPMCHEKRTSLVITDRGACCRIDFLKQNTARRAMAKARSWLKSVDLETRNIGASAPYRRGRLKHRLNDVDRVSQGGKRLAENRKIDELSAAFALRDQRGMFYADCVNEYLKAPTGNRRELIAADCWDRPTQPAFSDEVARLDIRKLGKAGAWQRKELIALQLDWPEAITGDALMVLITDLREGEPPAVVVAIIGGSSAYWHRIDLQIRPSSGANRYYFICPISLAPCEILYLRGGIFAARDPQLIYYRSQHRKAGSRQRPNLRAL